jgi:hypothetical protein
VIATKSIHVCQISAATTEDLIWRTADLNAALSDANGLFVAFQGGTKGTFMRRRCTLTSEMAFCYERSDNKMNTRDSESGRSDKAG